MTELFRRLRYLMNRRRYDRELAGDMEAHREMAGREGHHNFGNPLRLREEARDAWGWTWIDRLFQDLRYATRALLNAPGFTMAAVLMLAIGIGANVAVFAFFDLMVLRPLNVRDPATLVRFHRRGLENFAYALPYPEMAFFREHTRTLSAVIALNTTNLSMKGEPKAIQADFVSANFFRELGGAPVMGRFIDDAADASPVVVLGHGFWRSHFGGDPSIVGKTIHVNGKPGTVIGVAPVAFSGLRLREPALWAPIPQQPYFAAGSRLLTDLSMESSGVEMFGRLQPGVTPAIAEQELRSLAAQLRLRYPDAIWDKEALPSEAAGYADSLMVGNRRGTGSEGTNELYPVLGLVSALVLLILAVACGNLGSLLLARGVAREREISIRVALGAGRLRLIRQLFTESLLLAVLGSAAGTALAFVLLRYLMAWTGAPGWLNPTPDWRVIAFAAGAGFGAAILFGLMPAIQTARRRHQATKARQLLVGAQVAASCVLLIVAALLGRAWQHAVGSDPGFDYRNVIAIEPGLSKNGYTPEQARAYIDSLSGRLRGLPGVERVALVLTPPLGRGSIVAGVDIDGHRLTIQMNHVDPDYLGTMKIPLLRGRNLTRSDTAAIVISESFARNAWPGQDPVGKKFTMDHVDYLIAGIAGSARQIKLEDSDSVEAYFPITTDDMPGMALIFRTTRAPEDAARSAIGIARSLDPRIFPEVRMLKTAFHEKVQEAENTVVAVSLLGAIAHLLACLGVFGVVAYAVSQRTKEIGLRMALGAKASHVLTVVLRQFAIPVAAGLMAGVGAAAALSHLLRHFLYGVSNFDPLTYGGAVLLFLVTVALAALLPARQALRVDPMIALRHD